MDVTMIELPTKTVRALSGIAKDKGKTLSEYLRDLAETEHLASKSFDDILAPIRQGFAEGGMSEDEIIQMFEQAREDVYQESRDQKQ